MAYEIFCKLAFLNEGLAYRGDQEVQCLLRMLDEAGCHDYADEAREWDWMEEEDKWEMEGEDS
jgi:hypothetical protein